MKTVARRTLLAGATAATGLGAVAWLQSWLRPVAIARSLLESVAGPPTLRSPEVTGVPDGELTDRLWQLFTRIAARWDMTGVITLDAAGFAAMLRLKCTEVPSYLTEYREAARLLEELAPGMARDPASFDQLFAQPAGVPTFGTTRLGRLQAFVIGEFLELQMAYGGFRAFGYVNYRGFAGGPLDDAAHLPYRHAASD